MSECEAICFICELTYLCCECCCSIMVAILEAVDICGRCKSNSNEVSRQPLIQTNRAQTVCTTQPNYFSSAPTQYVFELEPLLYPPLPSEKQCLVNSTTPADVSSLQPLSSPSHKEALPTNIKQPKNKVQLSSSI